MGNILTISFSISLHGDYCYIAHSLPYPIGDYTWQQHYYARCQSKINPGRKTLQKKQSKTARFAATEILCTLYQKRSPVKHLFDQAVQKHSLPANERNLAMQLIYGVLRHRQYLDRILALLSRTPLHKIAPFVHQALAIGLYQLFFLERIPESAAVNEAVDSCKAAKIPQRLHGFVNGILRQAIRQKSTLATEALTDDRRQTASQPSGLAGQTMAAKFWFCKKRRESAGPIIANRRLSFE